MSWRTGDEDLLRQAILKAHPVIVRKGLVDIANLKISCDENGIPIAAFRCPKTSFDLAHGLTKRPIDAILQPRGLYCDVCEFLAAVIGPDQDPQTLRWQVEQYMDAYDRDRIDLRDLRYAFHRNDKNSKMTIVVSYRCLRPGPDGRPHGRQFAPLVEVRRAEFRCTQCSAEAGEYRNPELVVQVPKGPIGYLLPTHNTFCF